MIRSRRSRTWNVEVLESRLSLSDYYGGVMGSTAYLDPPPPPPPDPLPPAPPDILPIIILPPPIGPAGPA